MQLIKIQLAPTTEFRRLAWWQICRHDGKVGIMVTLEFQWRSCITHAPKPVEYHAAKPDHYNDGIVSAMVSQITGVSIVCPSAGSGVDKKKHTKAPRHWHLCEEFTGDRWISHTNGKEREKCFHLITSSCIWIVYQFLILENISWGTFQRSLFTSKIPHSSPQTYGKYHMRLKTMLWKWWP